MTRSARLKLIPPSRVVAPGCDLALLVPWFATGTLDPKDARQMAASVTDGSDLAEDLTAARAEQAEVAAMGEALGRPSMRPMMALFAAIDAEARHVEAKRVRQMRMKKSAAGVER